METLSFLEISGGSLEGFLYEKQYDTFVESLNGDEIWFAYEFSRGDMNFTEVSENDVREKMLEFRRIVNERKKFNTFPFTYIKRQTEPVFIKVYDPLKCGSSCSLTTPDPWWIFSRIKPIEEDFKKVFPVKTEKKSFFKRL